MDLNTIYDWKPSHLYSKANSILYLIKIPWSGESSFRGFQKINTLSGLVLMHINGVSKVHEIADKVAEKSSISKDKATKLTFHILKKYEYSLTVGKVKISDNREYSVLDNMINAKRIEKSGKRYYEPQSIFWGIPNVPLLPGYIIERHEEAGLIGVKNIMYSGVNISSGILNLVRMNSLNNIKSHITTDRIILTEDLKRLYDNGLTNIMVMITPKSITLISWIVDILKQFPISISYILELATIECNEFSNYIKKMMKAKPIKIYIKEKYDGLWWNSIQIEEMKRKINDFIRHYDVPIYLLHDCHNPGYLKSLHPCSKFGRQTLAVRSNGIVVICLMTCRREFDIGNLKNNSIMEVWDSEEVKKWINMTEQNYIHEVCSDLVKLEV